MCTRAISNVARTISRRRRRRCVWIIKGTWPILSGHVNAPRVAWIARKYALAISAEATEDRMTERSVLAFPPAFSFLLFRFFFSLFVFFFFFLFSPRHRNSVAESVHKCAHASARVGTQGREAGFACLYLLRRRARYRDAGNAESRAETITQTPTVGNI